MLTMEFKKYFRIYKVTLFMTNKIKAKYIVILSIILYYIMKYLN